eukprot:12619551-Prorocentrum_lima.AAC.1
MKSDMDDEALQRTISNASMDQLLRMQQLLRDKSRETADKGLAASIAQTEAELKRATLTPGVSA